MLSNNTITRSSERIQWQSWFFPLLLLVIGFGFAILVTDPDKKIGVVQFSQEAEFIIGYWILCFFCLGYGMFRVFLHNALSKAWHWLVLMIILVISVDWALLVAALQQKSYIPTLQTLVVLFLPLLALLPFLLYVSFLLIKRAPLKEELQLNLERIYFDADKSRSKIIAMYINKFENLFGLEKNLPTFRASLPIVFTTMLMSLGWLYIAPKIMVDVITKNATSMSLDPLICGFIGAYLFSLNFLFRRYIQSDLGPVAYSNINLRLIATFIWTMLIWNLGDDATKNILAFTVGIFPDVGWQWLIKRVQSITEIGALDQLKNCSLSRISGMTIWIESRLLEEDIENVQNLATANLPELLLQTNYSPERLISWIDEAILQKHLIAHKKKLEDDRLDGITTASGFLAYYYQNPPQTDSEALTRLVCEIENEANLVHIKAWHEANGVQSPHCS